MEKEYKTPNYPKMIKAKKMEKEISLSDWETQYYGFVFPKSKVKEFIQKLKDELVIKHFKTVKETAEQGVRDIVKIIDKLAGEELTK